MSVSTGDEIEAPRLREGTGRQGLLFALLGWAGVPLAWFFGHYGGPGVGFGGQAVLALLAMGSGVLALRRERELPPPNRRNAWLGLTLGLALLLYSALEVVAIAVMFSHD